jgi:hypothetical protein
MLDGHDTPSREAFPVTDTINIVNDGNFRVAAEEKVSVQRVWPPLRLDSAAGSDQSLSDNLSAENPLPSRLRRASAKQVHLKLLEVQGSEEVSDSGH